MSDFLDESTLAEMEKIEGEQGKKKRTKKVNHTAPELSETEVWVKCVSDLRPFASKEGGETFPLEFWHDYKIKADEAVLLHDRQMVVILKPKENEE